MTEDIIILMAEDDKGHFILTKNCLRRAGIENEIVQLTDGQELYDYIYGNGRESQLKPDRKYVLLLDIRMPKVDGLQVLERLKHDEDLKGIPVIIISTSDNPSYIEQCEDLGCSAYIIKPLGQNLVDAIENACQFV